jgi:hypothetical protein
MDNPVNLRTTVRHSAQEIKEKGITKSKLPVSVQY